MTSPDRWNPSAYQSAANFVPELTSKIVQWLNPQSTDHILDVGCGDGVLTAKLQPRCWRLVGLDASPSMIEAAQANYPGDDDGRRGLGWSVVDCRFLERLLHADAGAGGPSTTPILAEGMYDKIISNAALHWILRDADTRTSVLRAMFKLLKPGGTLVFEMGGAGNVAEAHTALLFALVVHTGMSIEEAKRTSPWFFPSDVYMKQALEDVGFHVEKIELEYRPTRLAMSETNGAIEGWISLFGAQFLEKAKTDEQRKAMVKAVCEVLDPVMKREEEGSYWLGYVRLRALAVKPDT